MRSKAKALDSRKRSELKDLHDLFFAGPWLRSLRATLVRRARRRTFPRGPKPGGLHRRHQDVLLGGLSGLAPWQLLWRKHEDMQEEPARMDAKEASTDGIGGADGTRTRDPRRDRPVF